MIWLSWVCSNILHHYLLCLAAAGKIRVLLQELFEIFIIDFQFVIFIKVRQAAALWVEDTHIDLLCWIGLRCLRLLIARNLLQLFFRLLSDFRCYISFSHLSTGELRTTLRLHLTIQTHQSCWFLAHVFVEIGTRLPMNPISSSRFLPNITWLDNLSIIALRL